MCAQKLPIYQIVVGLLGYWSESQQNNLLLDFEKMTKIFLNFSQTFPDRSQFSFRLRGGDLYCQDINIAIRNLFDMGLLIQEVPSGVYHLTPQGIKMYEEQIRPALQEAGCWEFIISNSQ